jgi:hypothetical protein
VLEITGLTVGAVMLRTSRSTPPILKAAILAQTADLVTFTFIFANAGQGERNPLAHLIVRAAKGIIGSATNDQIFLVNWLSVLVMVGLKLGLIAFLVWASPRLGRYQRPVLLAATAAGIAGALFNVISLPIFVGPGA